MVSEFATQLWGRIPFPPLIRPLLIRMFLTTTSVTLAMQDTFNYNIWSHRLCRILFSSIWSQLLCKILELQHLVTLAEQDTFYTNIWSHCLWRILFTPAYGHTGWRRGQLTHVRSSIFCWRKARFTLK